MTCGNFYVLTTNLFFGQKHESPQVIFILIYSESVATNLKFINKYVRPINKVVMFVVSPPGQDSRSTPSSRLAYKQLKNRLVEAHFQTVSGICIWFIPHIYPHLQNHCGYVRIIRVQKLATKN